MQQQHQQQLVQSVHTKIDKVLHAVSNALHCLSEIDHKKGAELKRSLIAAHESVCDTSVLLHTAIDKMKTPRHFAIHTYASRVELENALEEKQLLEHLQLLAAELERQSNS